MFRSGPVREAGCRPVTARPTVRCRSYDLATGAAEAGTHRRTGVPQSPGEFEPLAFSLLQDDKFPSRGTPASPGAPRPAADGDRTRRCHDRLMLEVVTDSTLRSSL